MKHLLVTAAAVALVLCPPIGAQESPQTQPATQPSTLEQLKAQEREAFEQRNNDTPAIGPFAVNEVVRLGLRDDHRLTAGTRLGGTEGERRINVSDDPGYWRAVVHQDPRDDSEPMMFMIEKYDFLNPSTVYSHAQLLAAPTQVQVVGDWEFPDGSLHVALLDAVGSVDPDEGIVTPGSTTLFVNGYDNEGGRNVNLRLRAANLKSLRREHPREISAYLRPVLRELHADELVAIDAKLAWQVLGAERKPDPEMEKKVHAILPQLDAESFTDREKAAQALRDLGVEGALVMLQLDRSKLSPEQNARVEEVIAAYHQAAVTDVSKLADDLDFLLDVLLTDDVELRRMALQRISQKVDRPIEFDVDATLRQRADRAAALRDELLPPPATQAIDPS